MSKPITLSMKAWANLYQKLGKDNPASVILIREKMKAVLGFTVRRHQEWIMGPGGDDGMYPKETICLDFYNEPKRTMFLLKYSEYIGKTDS